MTKSFDAPIKPTGNKITREAHNWGVVVYVNGETWGAINYIGDEENHVGFGVHSWYHGRGDVIVTIEDEVGQPPKHTYEKYDDMHVDVEVLFTENPMFKDQDDASV